MLEAIEYEYFKKEIKNKIYNEKIKQEILEITKKLIFEKEETFYRNEKNKIYIQTSIKGKIINQLKKKGKNKKIWFPKFQITQLEKYTKKIIENKKEINYEISKKKKTREEKILKMKPELTKEEIEKLKKEKQQKAERKKLKQEEKRNQQKTWLKEALQNKKNIFCFDIEKYEKNQKKVLEIGYSMYISKEDRYINKNILIEENIDLENGIFVSNNKYNFEYGETKIMPLKEAIKEVTKLMKESEIVVGHDIQNDFKTIKRIKNQKIFDTQIVVKPEELGYKGQISLFKIATAYLLYPENLHNAGNDAYFTLQSALRMYY